MKSNMYKDVKTWNPFVGCKFDCIYCKPSFQQQMKRVAGIICCKKCHSYEPHEHSKRLNEIPSGRYKIIFVNGTGDISYCEPGYMRQVINRVTEDRKINPNRLYYFQSKNPKCFKQYLGDFPRENVLLVTTLETNRDKGYEKISKAPLPTQRYADFKAIEWPRKILTVEPIMEFDHDIFYEWIVDLKPELVWIGYNSRSKQVKLPEPSLEKTQLLIAELRSHGIEVREKQMRDTHL